MATKMITGVCRLSYEHIWEPRAIQEGQEAKYSATILIPKTDTATTKAVIEAIKAEVGVGWPKGKPATGFKMPLKDGDKLTAADGTPREECKGMFVLNASSKSRPGVVGLDRQDIIDRDAVYSGCWCRFSLAFAPYDLPASKGIGAYLNHVQKIRDGESLAGKTSAKDAFDDGYKPSAEDVAAANAAGTKTDPSDMKSAADIDAMVMAV